jgi:hypothetical protein
MIGSRILWTGMAAAFLLAGAASASAQEPGEKKAAPLVPLVQLQGYEFICKGVGFFAGFGHVPHAKACPPQVHAIFDAIVAFGKTGTRSAVSAVTDEP